MNYIAITHAVQRKYTSPELAGKGVQFYSIKIAFITKIPKKYKKPNWKCLKRNLKCSKSWCGEGLLQEEFLLQGLYRRIPRIVGPRKTIVDDCLKQENFKYQVSKTNLFTFFLYELLAGILFPPQVSIHMELSTTCSCTGSHHITHKLWYMRCFLFLQTFRYHNWFILHTCLYMYIIYATRVNLPWVFQLILKKVNSKPKW